MRKFLLAVIAALFATVTMSAFAADPVTADPAKAASKPGRSIDEGTVKADPAKAAAKPGRAADEEKPATDGGGKKKKGKKKKKAE